MSMINDVGVQPSGLGGKVLTPESGVGSEKRVEQGAALRSEKTSEEVDSSGKDSPSVLQKAVEDINSMVESKNRQLRFSMDDSSGRPVITVMDSESEDVIREIPSEEVRRLAARIREVQNELGAATGLIVDNRV